MSKPTVSYDTIKRVLKKATLDSILTDDRVTSHGLNILERWCQRETSVVRSLERNPEQLVAVLLDQQQWVSPFAYESHDWQLRNGLVEHEIHEMGGQNLSCHHALERLGLR